MNCLKKIILFFILFFCTYGAIAQTSTELKKILQKVDSINLKPEKIYLHFDRNIYFQGDTAYFKAYVFESAFLAGSTKSGLIYIEISNRNNELIKRQVFPLSKGIGAGQLYFNINELPEGAYTVRAYTNWNRNFGEEHIFQKSFYLTKPIPPQWLVNIYPRILNSTTDNLLFHLKMNTPKLEPLAFRSINIKVNDGERELISLVTKTDQHGAFNVPVNLNQIPKSGLQFELDEPGKQIANLKTPISLLPDVDLQFMPEGGQFLANIKNKIGFKAVGIDGLGLDIKGKILNNEGKQIAIFKSMHKGMGNFELVPKEGDKYRAVVNVYGREMVFELPLAKKAGTNLSIINLTDPDSLTVLLRTNALQNKGFYLIALARGVVCYAKVIHINGGENTYKVSKKEFPSGVTRFVLLSQEGKPINERNVFINHNDNLQIKFDTLQTVKLDDSIHLDLHVTDAEGLPVEGTFSVAATDQGFNVTGSKFGSNLLTTILLSSDLKGNIEQPGYYFEKSAWQELDNLMLTQGWKSYKWDEPAKQTKQQKFEPEQYYAIKGKAMNAFGKSLSNVEILLLARKPQLLFQTFTDKDGKFEFRDLPEIDTPVIRLDAKNRNGKNFNVRIAPVLFEKPTFATIPNPEKPWYLSLDSMQTTTVSNEHIAYYNPKLMGEMLKEVVINSKKTIKGSQSAFGRRRTDNIFTEKDLEEKPKLTLYDFIREKLPQFYPKVDIRTKKRKLVLDGDVKIFFDGVDIDWFYDTFDETLDYFTHLMTYLGMFTTEDVKGIEVMRRDGTTMIEITTKDGMGPYSRRIPGVVIFKPVSLGAPITFHTPKYQSNVTDQPLKPTLLWMPDLRTNSKGKAHISFFKNLKVGTFTLTIEGSDLQGNIGSLTQTFTALP